MNDNPFGPLRPADEPALARHLSVSYAFPESDIRAWWERADRGNWRVQRAGGAVVGGLLRIPMGQFFGGRALPMCGVAGVVTAPEARGAGQAKAMMAAALAEMHADGFALSTLYASTQSLYRAVDYECAGETFECRLRLREIGLRQRQPPLRAVAEADRAPIERRYRELAAGRQGWLDRNPYMWNRVRQPRVGTSHGFVLESGGEIRGWLYYGPQRDERGATLTYDFKLHDLQFTDAASARRLLGFLADHASMGHEALWLCEPADPLLDFLPERCYGLKLVEPWMLRVVDVERALAGRGWPAQAPAAALHFEIQDAVLPANHGRFVVEIHGGEGRVRRGGEGRLRLSIRDFAPLFTGYRSARTLRALGRLQAPDADVERADLLFAGPPPGLRDFF